MPKTYFIVFIAVVMSVYAAMHGFLYWRLSSGLSLTASQRHWLKLALIVGAVSFIAGEFLSRLVPALPLLFFGSVWLGVVSISLSMFLVEFFLSLAFPRQRRAFVLAALALVFVVSAISLLNAALGPVLRQVRVPLRGLDRDADGFTIVHLSDLHLGNLTSMRRLRRVVERVNALDPDLICVTGDTLDGDVCRDEKYCAALAGLRARHGVAAVTGNHEFYAGIDKFLELARRSRWRVLRNQSWIIEGRLAVVGLEEDTAARFRLPGPDLETALRDVPQGMPTVLLYHQPTHFAEAVRRGIDLQLSGHTHAGQIPPMDLLVWLVYKYPSGLHRLGSSFIYTSPGTGTWGPPMRFLSRSQIVQVVLAAGEAKNGGETNRMEEGT
ncbi:MAG: metallophosphoesterase [Candidatus Aminicenantes bacterium]|nr:metallophosphoesterase [Candidatus Aminicenantes bacterium]